MKPVDRDPSLFLRGELYPRLLKLARTHCTEFSLVKRPLLRRSEDVTRVFGELEPFVVSERVTKRWPGTISAEAVTLYRYVLSRESSIVLAQAEGLFDWRHPVLPEDLAFYSSIDKVWMWSCAHERLAAWGDAGIAVSCRRTLPDV